MKKIASLLLFGSLSVAAMAQTKPAEPLQFREAAYDFGSVPQGKPVYHTFVLKNTGAKTVVLNDVHASCGCTTPEWSKAPIAPGASSSIKVGFNAAAEGPFEKFISVQYNDSVQKQIKITGSVWQVAAGAAPLNVSVQFLKQ